MTAPTASGFATATLVTDAVPAKSITLPTRAAGDLLIAIIGADAVTTAISRTETTTWAIPSNEVGANNQLAVLTRIATNDANDALTVGATNNNDFVGTILVIAAGTHGVTTAADIVFVAMATGTSATADPPAIDGLVAKDWLAVAIAVVDITAADASNITAAPTGYTTGAFIGKSATSTTSVALGVGYKALSAAQTENPGTFANTSGAWLAKTLLVPPTSPDKTVNVGTATLAATANNVSHTATATVGTATLAATANNVEAWLTFAEGVSTTTSATVTGLTNGLSYDFRVAAVNAIGTGPFSSTVTASPVTAVNVTVGTATCAVTANNASHTIASTIGTATVAATGNNVAPTSGILVAVGTATAAVTGFSPSHTITSTIGTATLVATANNATIPTVVLYATAISSNRRYLVDQNGDPWFMAGTTPQLILHHASTADMDTYFGDQGSRGYNYAQVELISGNNFVDNYFLDANGDAPFTDMVHLTTPVTAYWANVDTLISTAQTNGFTLGLNPIDNYAWNNLTSGMSTGDCTDYGTFLGNRYKDTAGIIWVFGNDFDGGDYATRNPKYLAILSGIRGTGDTHPSTLWLQPGIATHANSGWDEDDGTGCDVILGYSYTAVYGNVASNYAHSAATYPKPVYLGEASYQFEANGGPGSTTPLSLRKNAWWPITYGACGFVKGQYPEEYFTGSGAGGTWDVAITDTGGVPLSYIVGLYTQFDGWWDLVPDTGHALITAGRGTEDGTASYVTNDYFTIALTPNGLLAIGYCPTSRSGITLDTSQMSGTVTAKWWDPTLDFTQTPVDISNPAAPTHPGNNSLGVGDWVIVLTGTAGDVTVDVGTATLAATANNASHAVASTIGTATLATTANNSSASVKPTTGTGLALTVGQNASHTIASTIGTATLASTANNSSAAIASTIGTATLTGTGYDATITASGATNVAVGTATLAATANNASHTIALTTGTGVLTGTGNDSSSSVKPTSGTATVASAAYQPTISTAVIHNVDVGTAVCTTTANNAKHTIASTIDTAVAPVTAYGPAVSKFVAVGTATCAVTANNASLSIGAGPGCATAAATAYNSSVAILAGVGYALAVVVANNLTRAIPDTNPVNYAAQEPPAFGAREGWTFRGQERGNFAWPE